MDRISEKIATRLMVVLPFLVVAALAACSRPQEFNRTEGDLNVSIHLERNPPVVGANAMTVQIVDGSGKAVTDAEVHVAYSMPAMPGMPAMHYSAKGEPFGAHYKATLDISMVGAWEVKVNITRQGSTSTVKFNVDAR